MAEMRILLLGNDDGSFEAARSFSAGTNPQSVTVGDFNGDGKPDLAVANSGSNNVSVLLGNGDGSFQAPQNFGTGSSPVSVAVGDFNGDGKFDLAVANSGSVSVLINNTPMAKQRSNDKKQRQGTGLRDAQFPHPRPEEGAMRNSWITLGCLTAVLWSQSLGAASRLRAQHLAGTGPAG